MVDAEERAFQGAFLNVGIATLGDMQVLGLVPEELAESDILEAMVKDDAEAISTARSLAVALDNGCSCHGGDNKPGAGSPARTFRASLRGTYNAIRKVHHVHLADVMTRVLKRDVPFDSLEVRHVYTAARNLRLGQNQVWPTLALADMEVELKGTINLPGRQNLILANGIRFSKGGRLVIPGGSYLHVKCVSFQGHAAGPGENQFEQGGWIANGSPGGPGGQGPTGSRRAVRSARERRKLPVVLRR